MFPAELVTAVLDALPDAIVDGGWGIDALLGAQTRDHDDLDLVVPIDTLDRTIASLSPLGFGETVDERPTHVVVARDDDTHVDLHLVMSGDSGPVQALPNRQQMTYALGETIGHIDGRDVRCLRAPMQLVAHSGYEPDDGDVADMLSLRDRFDLSLPPPYISVTGDEPIRHATADDAAALVVVRERSWKAAYAGLMPQPILDAMDGGASLAWFGPFLAEPPTARYCMLVAGEPGSVVGFSLSGPSPDDPDEAVIFSLYVDPTGFGLGIGKRMLDMATASLREVGFERLTLWVLDGNTGAQRFYEREGWRVDGAHKTETEPAGSYTSVRYRLACE